MPTRPLSSRIYYARRCYIYRSPALTSYWKCSRPKLTRIQLPRLLMPTTGYSLPDMQSTAFPICHCVSLHIVNQEIFRLLTKRSPIFSESDSFIKGDVASDHVSDPKCVAVSYPCARLCIELAVISVISPR